MKLVRYHHPLSETFSDFDRWFRSPLDGFGRLLDLADRLGQLPTPGVAGSVADLFEDDGNYHARLKLPGVKKEDLKVELHDHQLTIACERKANAETEATVFKRVVTVPEGIDADQVSARLEDGILTVTLPKSAERKPRQISVN